MPSRQQFGGEYRLFLAVAFVGLTTMLVMPSRADQIDTTLFNATTNSGGDEAPGLGTGFSVSSSVGGTDDPQGAFGNNDGPIEPSTFIFGDGGTTDNGNGTMGDGGETVDTISWSTTSPVLITGYRFDISGDGGGASRGTDLVRFNSAGEADDFWDANFSSGATNRTFAIPQIASSFSINTTRSSTAGPRINEIDAIVPDSLPGTLRVAPIHFNATTNVVGEGDDAPGLALGFSNSTLLAGETIQDAFGNNNGGVEGNTVIFSDSGAVADNLNNTFDVGTETIDFIEWTTSSALTVYGYQIGIGADSPAGSRGVELMRFYVNGVVRDTIDANHVTTMNVQRVFGGGAATGSTFRLEVTRFAATGPRIFEIDPILAQNVAPTANANGAYTYSAGVLSQTLSSAGSVDPEAIPLAAYNWSTSGTISTAANPTIGIASTGLTHPNSTVPLTLTVTDFEGATGNSGTQFNYTNAAPTANAGGALAFNASLANVTANGSGGDVDLAVNATIVNFETHALDWTSGASPIGNTPSTGYAAISITRSALNGITFAQAVAAGLTTTSSSIPLTLTATDFSGSTATSSTTISYSNSAPSAGAATATVNPNYSVSFFDVFTDLDLAGNGFTSSFETLTFEFDLTQATLASQVGDGFFNGGTSPTQTTSGTLSGTLSLSQLISLFGGLGTYTAWANVRDAAGLVASQSFTVNVVPEPSSLLVWSGLATLVCGARWRRRGRGAAAAR